MKQKFLLLMLLLLSCWGGARADELTVYDGTSTNGYVPVYGSCANYYQKCEFVIPADELSDMKGGTLSAMTFYLYSRASSAWTGTFQVFLKEVSETTISAYSGTDGATIVYEGTLDATKTTMKIIFSSNYTYEGGNLLVGVYETVKGNYYSASFYGTTVSGACVGGYNSSSLDNVLSVNQRNFIPKTTFTYEGGSIYKRPVSLTASGLKYHEATLSWTAPETTASLVGYECEYKKRADETWIPTSFAETPATLSDLMPGTTYSFRVRAKYEGGNVSGWTTRNFTTQSYDSPSISISNNNIGTEWVRVSINMPISAILNPDGSITNLSRPSPDSYELSYREKANSEESENEWIVVDEVITSSPYLLTGLVGETQYELRMRAKYGIYFSGYSSTESFTTLSYCTIPSKLMATDIMRDEATLSWTGYQDSYDVRWRTVPILFMDGFEDGLGNWFLSDCHSYTSISNVDGHSGEKRFYFYGDSNYPNQILLSRELEDIPKGAKLTFWYFAGSYYTQYFKVGYSTASNLTDDFIWSEEIPAPKTWTQYEQTLPAGTKFVSIQYCHSTYSLNIDDVIIFGPESEFGEWKPAENQGNPCTIKNLTSGQDYEWQVMGKSEHCSGTDWSESRYFTTLKTSDKFFVKDGDWNDVDNWDPGFPETTEDAYIKANAIIPADGVADVQKLTVFPGGSITLKDGGQLKTTSSNVPVTFEKSITGYGEGDGTNHFIASPVVSLLKDVENLRTGDYDFYFFESFNQLEWINVKNLSAYYPPEMDPDEYATVGPKGGLLYAAKEDKTLKFMGSTGYPSKLYVTQNNVSSGSGGRFDGWYLLGNPYTCDAYVTLEEMMYGGNGTFITTTTATPISVDVIGYGAPEYKDALVGDIDVNLDDGSPIVIDVGGPSAIFYKMNATGDALNMYYDRVKLAPGEGVLVHAVIPPTPSGSGPTPDYGITFFTEDIYGDELSLAPEGDILIPILPRHGLAVDQDANGIVLMNDEDNSATLAKYDKENVGDELLDVTLQDRTLYTDGRWNTLCLPFNLTAEQLTLSPLNGFQIKELDTEAGTYDHETGYEESSKTLWLNFKEATKIEAGKPYIAKNTIFPLEGSGIELENIVNPTFWDVKIDSSDPVGITSTDNTTTFKGVYDPVVFAKGTEKRDVLFLQNGNLYYPDGTNPTTIGACRAYFPLNGIYGGVPDLSIKSFVLNFGDGETAIEEIVNGKSSNGKSDEWYSIDGRKLEGKPVQRGIYINNNKKTFIK